MGDLLWLGGVILVVWVFVSILNRLWGNKGGQSASHYDKDDILDRLNEDDDNQREDDNSNADDSNDYDYDYDND
ncbi:hypothetical protein [Fredinandcohnia sp. 179-A 10B2 NHS]|uniref:hypothetical protein n=1 Tax=Fredinandcohnia sp. 179-A 10B2 NHS TaxID=3235176 RepID=UPI0039A29CC9